MGVPVQRVLQLLYETVKMEASNLGLPLSIVRRMHLKAIALHRNKRVETVRYSRGYVYGRVDGYNVVVTSTLMTCDCEDAEYIVVVGDKWFERLRYRHRDLWRVEFTFRHYILTEHTYLLAAYGIARDVIVVDDTLLKTIRLGLVGLAITEKRVNDRVEKEFVSLVKTLQ